MLEINDKQNNEAPDIVGPHYVNGVVLTEQESADTIPAMARSPKISRRQKKLLRYLQLTKPLTASEIWFMNNSWYSTYRFSLAQQVEQVQNDLEYLHQQNLVAWGRHSPGGAQYWVVAEKAHDLPKTLAIMLSEEQDEPAKPLPVTLPGTATQPVRPLAEVLVARQKNSSSQLTLFDDADIMSV